MSLTKIRGSQIQSKTVDYTNVADRSITSGQIALATITNAEVAAAAASNGLGSVLAYLEDSPRGLEPLCDISVRRADDVQVDGEQPERPAADGMDDDGLFPHLHLFHDLRDDVVHGAMPAPRAETGAFR